MLMTEKLDTVLHKTFVGIIILTIFCAKKKRLHGDKIITSL